MKLSYTNPLKRQILVRNIHSSWKQNFTVKMAIFYFEKIIAFAKFFAKFLYLKFSKILIFLWIILFSSEKHGTLHIITTISSKYMDSKCLDKFWKAYKNLWIFLMKIANFHSAT